MTWSTSATRGEMHDRVAAGERRRDGVGVAEVAEHGLDVAGAMVRRRNEVEDPRLEPSRLQLVDDVRSDKAGAAGDEHFHCTASSLLSGR